jgi:hypothetical protein
MPSKRKFWKTVVTVTILSETPFDYDNLSDIQSQIDGDCSGEFDTTSSEEIDAATCAALLIKQHSDPEFFNLDENGEDTTSEFEEEYGN